jgi:hypothetical protein
MTLDKDLMGAGGAGGEVVAESDCTVMSANKATCGSVATQAGDNVTIAVARNGVDFVPLATQARRRCCALRAILLLRFFQRACAVHCSRHVMATS